MARLLCGQARVCQPSSGGTSITVDFHQLLPRGWLPLASRRIICGQVRNALKLKPESMRHIECWGMYNPTEAASALELRFNWHLTPNELSRLQALLLALNTDPLP